MKNKTKYIPALLLCPFLFMGAGYGNHPGYAYPLYYQDCQLTAISFEEADENGEYPFSVTIENTGERYITINSLFSLETRDQHFDFVDDIALTKENVQYNFCLPPHTTGTFKSLTPSKNVFTLEDCTPYCYAFEIYTDVEVEWTSISYLGKETVEGGAYYNYQANDYSYHCEEEDYFYFSKVVDVTIKGEHYAFFDDFASENISLGLIDDTLTSEDIVIENIKLIKGTDSGKRATEAFMKGLMWCGIAIFIGIVFLLTFGVFPIFILPVIIKKSKQKNK